MYIWCTNSQELRKSGNVGLYPALLIELFVYCKSKETLRYAVVTTRKIYISCLSQDMWRVIVMSDVMLVIDT
jgi:hypothetical protein